MGFNAKYRFWTRQNWQGYAPTISAMERKGWSLTLKCQACQLLIGVDPQKIIRQRGPTWSPWGRSAPCPRLGCGGRMTMSAYAPRPGVTVDV